LATVGEDGQPSARVVLLRGLDARGFVFYTNSTSRKGQQIAENPRLALCFYWDPLAEQVRVEGVAEQISPTEADAYWRGRPREHQISAWASFQSQVLPSREALEQRVLVVRGQFADREIDRPPYWTGYRVLPHRIEFWRSVEARLHERVVYRRYGDTWITELLYP
jgi:pyridoxamine 5'-phosphate oxidase